MKKEVIGWVLGLLAMVLLVWFLAFNNLLMFKVFGPATEQVRREM